MAYLMSDMAAGSNAAMTMMENMGGAPLAADVGQAKAEQVIANTQKAKLANLVAETGFKSAEESRAKLKELQQSPEFKAALDEQDYGKVLRMTGATQMMSSDVENGAKTIAAAETLDAKKLAYQQKQLDFQAQQIGNAYAVINAVPDDKVEEAAKQLPPQTLKALVNEVGEANWNMMSGVQKKMAAKNLMLNAKGQLATQLQQGELQKREMEMIYRERIAAAHDIARANSRATGADRDMRDWKLYQNTQAEIERSGRKTLEKLDAEVDAAYVAQEKSKLSSFGSWFDSSTPSEKTKTAHDAAIAKRNDFQRKQTEREINLVTSTPSFPGKESILENLTKQLELYPKAPPTADEEAEKKRLAEEAAAAAKNKPAPGKPGGKEVPSNKDQGTKTSPMAPPKSAAEAVDGKYYTTKMGVLKWDAKSQSFVE